MSNSQQYLQAIGQQAKLAKRILATASGAQKQLALNEIAQTLIEQQQAILQANAQDISAGEAAGLDAPLLDRLRLTPERLQTMAHGITQIASLPEIVGEISQMRTNARGLQIGRMRVPLGVIGMIYESRPNVTADAAALCIKSGNVVILRGGSEAKHSNKAIMDAIHQGLDKAGLPIHAAQLIAHTDREYVSLMLKADDIIDVIIPRGGKGLVSLVAKEARMPVLKHLDGICHIYVDKYADIDKAVTVADNGKTYRYGICGATETLLVHQAIAKEFLPKIATIYAEKNVEMRGCPQTQAILPNINAATDIDWQTEYLAPIISIRVVDSFEQAIEHIATYSSAHTDAIVTENLIQAQQFMQQVDSASVMVNTPTCFADGYEYGLGAEIGISTDKIHWRGPVGIEGLTAQKFIVISNGVTR